MPLDAVTFMRKSPHVEIKSFLKEKQKLLIRLFTLFASSLLLVIIRFSVMGFIAPTFQPVDNPASFVRNILLRALNYSYIYCLNAWLLICPEWLCFDWSMGCIPLITTYDKRIFFILIFWLVFGSLVASTFSPSDDKSLR